VEVREAIANVPLVSVDIETPYDNHTHIFMVGLGISPTEAYVVPWEDEFIDVVAELLRDAKRIKVGHNFAFDCAAFRANGIQEKGPNYDTLQAAALIWPPMPRSKANTYAGKAKLKAKFYDLASCVLRVCDGPAYWKQPGTQTTDGFYAAAFPGIREELRDRLYCALDVIYTFQLWQAEEALLRQQGMEHLFKRIVAPASVVLHDLEERGMYIDREMQQRLVDETENEMVVCENRIGAATQEYHEVRIAKIAAKIADLEAECLVLSTPTTLDSPNAPSVQVALPSTKPKRRAAKKSKPSELA
jgi:DNA polymerase I-like protein with 3'-5' exonuclease and polymerase domains